MIIKLPFNAHGLHSGEIPTVRARVGHEKEKNEYIYKNYEQSGWRSGKR